MPSTLQATNSYSAPLTRSLELSLSLDLFIHASYSVHLLSLAQYDIETSRFSCLELKDVILNTFKLSSLGLRFCIRYYQQQSRPLHP